MKANQIIRKLQEQLKQEQNKANLRGKIAAEQVTEIMKLVWVTHQRKDDLKTFKSNLNVEFGFLPKL